MISLQDSIRQTPQIRNLSHSLPGNEAIRWKFNRFLGSLISRKLLLEVLDSRRRRIESDMFFECGKMNQIAMESEDRYVIVDCFFRALSRFSDLILIFSRIS